MGVSRATFEHAIATLIGKAPANFSLPPAPFVPNPPAVPVIVPSELLERRPDIAGAERQVAAANAQIGVAQAAYYPRLALSATGGFQTSRFNEWFTWPSNFWSIGPSFSELLFDGGARRALTEQAKANYDATVASYRQTVLSAFEAVENYLASLRILSEEIGQQHTAVASATHYLDLSLVRYRGGVDSYLNVITAQNAVLTSRETEVQIQLRQMSASVGLVMALGGGWDASQLPNTAQLTAKQPKANPTGTTTPNSAPQPIAAPNPPPLPGVGEPPTLIWVYRTAACGLGARNFLADSTASRTVSICSCMAGFSCRMPASSLSDSSRKSILSVSSQTAPHFRQIDN